MINEEEANEIKEEIEDENDKAESSSENEEPEKNEEQELLKDLESIREELAKKIDKAEIEEIKAWKAEVLSRISSISDEIEGLKKEDERILNNFREFTDIITKKNEDIMKIVEQKVDAEKLRQFRKDVAKIDKKLNLVMEETGFGEILDVAKIPPNILEIVYDSTLKDVTNAIWQEYGPVAEKIIMGVLEDIRMETSGSEMFYFDGRWIRTRDVAKNIRRGMISARQLQDTYEALLRKLLDMVPGHKAKNFRAMIKLKSQEYTVDKTTLLLDKFEKTEKTIMMLNGMVSGLAKNLNSETERLRNAIEDLSKRVDEEVERLDNKIEEKMKELREYNEREIRKMNENMKKRMESMEKEIIKKMREITPTPEETGKEEKLSAEKLGEEERFIYSAIPAEGITLNRLRKITGEMIQTPLEEILERLESSSLIYHKKSGRGVKYYPQSEEVKDEKDVKNEMKEEKTDKNRDKVQKSEKTEVISDSLIKVLNSVPENGCTLNRLRKIIGESMNYEEILDAVKELVEREYLVVTTRGRHTIYMKNEEKIKEIGGEKDA